MSKGCLTACAVAQTARKFVSNFSLAFSLLIAMAKIFLKIHGNAKPGRPLAPSTGSLGDTARHASLFGCSGPKAEW